MILIIYSACKLSMYPSTINNIVKKLALFTSKYAFQVQDPGVREEMLEFQDLQTENTDKQKLRLLHVPITISILLQKNTNIDFKAAFLFSVGKPSSPLASKPHIWHSVPAQKPADLKPLNQGKRSCGERRMLVIIPVMYYFMGLFRQ